MMPMGIILVVLAGFAGLISGGWMLSFLELESEGNPFSGLLFILALGGFSVAAGFAAGGVSMISKAGKQVT